LGQGPIAAGFIVEATPIFLAQVSLIAAYLGVVGHPAAADLHALLDYLRKEHGARKFVFFGGSMGGTSSLIYATLHPQDVSVCVACCPDTDLPSFLDFCRVEKNQKDYTVLKDVLQKITAFYKNDAAVIARHSALQHVDKLTMPIRIVHGAQDPLAPVDQSRRLKAALEGRNTHFVYVEIPGGGHETPGQKVYFDASLAWAVKELAERP